jgi:hypothetical protein
MDRFKYLNFCTIYSSEGDVEVYLGEHACFGDVFEGPTYQSNTYNIHVYKEFSLIKNAKSNGCFLDLPQVNKHLNYLHRICDVTFNVTEEVDRDLLPYYKVEVNLSAHNLIHRFVLTWIRALYEFPYCVYLPEVYKLKKFKAFEKINVFNILNIIVSAFYLGDDIHMFTYPGRYPILKKFEEVKQELANINKEVYHNLLEIFSTEAENQNTINQEILFDEKSFNFRKQLYLDIYNKIKDGKEL